ncbi:MAG TPA: hypothetical protein VI703_02810 [Anaerolineales bacterium]|nr:hypothetical protein [Anaerolineales bacterium]
MVQKSALFLSIGLTAFIVFIFSGLLQAMAAVPIPAVAQGLEVSAATEISPELAQLISEREAAYIELINQANQRLVEAQAALEDAQANPSEGVSSQFTIEQATELALASALSGSQLTGEAQLVNFEGSVAYEVPFNLGNIYIDATSGALLFNGTINLLPSPITQEQAAQIASTYMGRTDVYKIEVVQLYGFDVFRVKFLNSDAVFVDPYGQILLVRLAPAKTANETPTNTSTPGGYNDDDGHEDEHEDDD